jgi:hypothetical protein
MRIRSLIAVATVAPLLAGVGSAHAAKRPPVKKPVCKLVTDATGDGTGTGTAAAGPNEPALDIVSADVATNATMLTAVFRVASLSGATDTAPTGRTYELSFKSGTTTITVRAVISKAGNTWQDGKGSGIVDTAGNEIRVSVPLSTLGVPVKTGDKLTDLVANSFRSMAAGGNAVVIGKADGATGATPYVAAWPSCIKVGT